LLLENNFFFAIIALRNFCSLVIQIQFRSQRLNDYMFKVIDGQVQRVEPIFGKKFYNQDGSVAVYTDGAVHIPQPEAQEHQPSSAAVINPKGYMLVEF
jgi:hypothetical protein